MTSPIRTLRGAPRVGPRLALALLAVAVVVGLTLAPRGIVAPARGAFMEVARAVGGSVVLDMTYDEVESILNALLFVPLGVTLAILLPRMLWVLAPIAGLGASVAVEYAQAAIPGRVPDLGDVVWNTAGALAGAVVIALLRLVLGPRRGHRAG